MFRLFLQLKTSRSIVFLDEVQRIASHTIALPLKLCARTHQQPISIELMMVSHADLVISDSKLCFLDISNAFAHAGINLLELTDLFLKVYTILKERHRDNAS